MYKVFVVCWKKEVLVAIRFVEHKKFVLEKTVLDWYAEKYLFDREHLTGYWVDTVEYQP